MNILITGGAGYIGSHAALQLLELRHSVTIVDDLSRGRIGAINALNKLGGDLRFIEASFGDRSVLDPLLREHKIEAVMHFAALTYVGESVEQPLRYYRNNTANALSLIEAMDDAGVTCMVFSSTAATYGQPPPEEIPIRETCPQKPVNPYGASKLMVERMLLDYAQGRDFQFAALRYFNVAGCDEQGRLGEHHEPETHLIPICLDAALGKRPGVSEIPGVPGIPGGSGIPGVSIFGDDYPTPDGTCIRDYVHVSDLIDAHIAALDALGRPLAASRNHPTTESMTEPTTERPRDAASGLLCNIGIGRGYSVREVVEACRRVTGVDFPVSVRPRRPGDPAVLYTDPAHAREHLHFKPRFTALDEIIETAWRWRKANPGGYA